MKDFAPYIVPLIVAVIVLRRAGQMRKVNTGRMWIRPVFLLLLLAGALAAEPFPGVIAIGGFVIAALAGVALGNYMATHQHLSVDPETGQLSSRTTTIGTLLVLGLFGIRFGAKLVFPELANPGHHASQMTAAANGLLIFTVAVLISQAVAIWRRTRPLLADHAARKALGASAGQGAQTPVSSGDPATQPGAQPSAQASE
jgi:hypothetical protein